MSRSQTKIYDNLFHSPRYKIEIYVINILQDMYTNNGILLS